MAVYGCRKTRARSSARGRDPAGIRPRPGDERHAGIGSPRRAPRRDVRHRQAGEGRGRRARPRGTRVRGGGAPNRPQVAGIACVRMADGSFGCTAFAADVSARGIAGRACATAMAEGADGAYRTGLVRRRKPFRDPRDPESATFRRVSWRGPEASAPVLGPPDTGTDRNRVLREPNGASRPTIRAEQKQAISPASFGNMRRRTVPGHDPADRLLRDAGLERGLDPAVPAPALGGGERPGHLRPEPGVSVSPGPGVAAAGGRPARCRCISSN